MLDGVSSNGPEEVMKHMGCIQGQDYQSALWAIGMRSKHGTTVSQIKRAFSSRKIVRTWLLRGTIHVANAPNVKWISNLLTPGLIKIALKRESNRGLDQETVDRVEKLFVEMLTGGNKLTRTEMYNLVEAGGVSPENNLGYHMLYRAAWDGLICFGDNDGDENTFVLLDEWIKNGVDIEGSEAIATLAETYFDSHGPAKLSDFAWWSGLRMKDIKSSLSTYPGIIAPSTMNPDLYISREIGKQRKTFEESVLLLPAYDEYFLGYADRSLAFGDDLTKYYSKGTPIYDVKFPVIQCEGRNSVNGGKRVPIVHKNGIFQPLVLVNGQIAGTWKREDTKNGISVAIIPFRNFSKSQISLLKEEVERYGQFLETDASLKL